MQTPDELKAPDESTTPHIVTEEDLKNNPDLVERGVKVGDEIGIPDLKEDATEEQTAE